MFSQIDWSAMRVLGEGEARDDYIMFSMYEGPSHESATVKQLQSSRKQLIY